MTFISQYGQTIDQFLLLAGTVPPGVVGAIFLWGLRQSTKDKRIKEAAIRLVKWADQYLGDVPGVAKRDAVTGILTKDFGISQEKALHYSEAAVNDMDAIQKAANTFVASSTPLEAISTPPPVHVVVNTQPGGTTQDLVDAVKQAVADGVVKSLNPMSSGTIILPNNNGTATIPSIPTQPIDLAKPSLTGSQTTSLPVEIAPVP